MHRSLRAPTVFSLALLSIGAAPRAQDAPPREVLTFTCSILGSGSDPLHGAGISRSVQNWTYARSITGWFEVESVRRRVGRGQSAHQRIEFRLPRDAAHQIAGVRHDEVYNRFTEWGEGGSSATYSAIESEDAEVELAAPERPFNLVLDAATEPSWDGMFVPFQWLPAIDIASRYEGHAHYDPVKNGGFGEEWRYHIDDRTLRENGERYVHVRYTPAIRGCLPCSPMDLMKRWPAWFDGKVARGHVELETPRPSDASGDFKMRMILDWTVTADLDDVELEVRSRNYGSWRPQAVDGSADEMRSPGPVLYLSSELRARDKRSKKPLPKIVELSWRLVDTSREPGIAMNWPYESHDRRHDLELVAGDLTPARDDENQTLVLRPEGPRSEVVVQPFDWGAHAALRVEARLEDGRVIEGYMLDPSAGRITVIPIPASRPGSHIARSWVSSHCPDFGADTDDKDSEPEGRGDGDGFSVFEEYRGFYVDGVHLCTEPSRKDLFVRAGLVRNAVPGALEQFAKLSGLAVHDRVRANEMAQPKRLMNVNHRNAPTAGPQTGLVLELGKGSSRQNDRIPPNARPVDVPVIEVPDQGALVGLSAGIRFAVESGDEDQLAQARRHMVVQALLQACGVERPGPADREVTVRFVPADPEKAVIAHYELDGRPIHYDREDGTCFDAIAQRVFEQQRTAGVEWRPEPMRLLLGEKGGAHSGPERCVMRDWYADLYATDAVRDGLPVYRMPPRQTPGTELGTTRRGTGINAAGRTPASCFGDSAVTTPARKQLAVKDGAR
ncbi:MAG: hypothetical protein U1F36_03200 [Planctomycetota bacterium]